VIFTQEDPIGLAAGTNLYQYVGNDPVGFTDPFGLCERPRGKGVGICIEAFIMARRVLGLAVGDNRSFSSSGGTFKTSVRFSINPTTGALSGVDKRIGKTGPLPGIGNLKIGKPVSNGRGGFNVAVSGSARSLVNPGGNIDFLFDINVSAKGEARVEVGAVGKFPSFEVFAFPADGGDAALIFSSTESGNPITSLFGEFDTVVVDPGG